MTHFALPLLWLSTLLLASCDDSTSFPDVTNTTQDTTSTIATDKSGSSTEETVQSIRIGRGESPFVVGEIEMGLAEISAGGMTSLKVRLVDQDGHPYKTPVEISFISRCASLDPQLATITSPVKTVNGIAESTYKATGCVGEDPINASATILNQGINDVVSESATVTAGSVLKIKDPIISSIQYISADPTNMVLKGLSGGAQQSTVTFRVVDISGNPVANQSVDFSLTTAIGNLEIVGPELDDLNRRRALTDGSCSMSSCNFSNRFRCCSIESNTLSLIRPSTTFDCV